VIDSERVRVIGVCFGHQIVGRALGTKVDRSDAGWEASVCEVDMNEKGFEVFGKKKLVSLRVFGCWKTLTVSAKARPSNAPGYRHCYACVAGPESETRAARIISKVPISRFLL
jgi:GMP synthase-like glutamine amidotransferase